MNSGGRKKFVKNSRVRILLLTGEVSKEVYIVMEPPRPKGADEEHDNGNNGDDRYVRADRKGHIFLRQENSTKEQKVHFRRILPVDIDGKVPVIESGDKYRAVCSSCGRVIDVHPGDDTINCPDCGEIPIHWLGVKPMADTTTTTEKKTTKTKKPATKKPTAAKKEKTVREPIKVNFSELKGLDDCELWTKAHVKFDHPDVDVRAHALLFVDGENSRKLCFNTYDGALGKKSPPLPIDEFIKDGVVKTGKREKPWFAVKDLEKTKTKLAKDGYEQQK